MIDRQSSRFVPSQWQCAVDTLAATALLLATGCSREPTLNLLGSFFPAWILCGIIGIVLTVLVRFVFVRLMFERYLWPLPLVYPCLAAFFTFTAWLLFFS